MTAMETKNISIGNIVFCVDCFGTTWNAKVVEGNKECLDTYHKEVGIEYIKAYPGMFFVNREDAYEAAREAKADYASAMLGWW